MVGPRLRELARRAEGAQRLDGADVQHGRAEHPVCGDLVELSWREADGRILELGWRANGCPAAVAVAAATAQCLVGAPRAEAATRLRAYLGGLGGLATHERHAERLVLEALGVGSP